MSKTKIEKKYTASGAISLFLIFFAQVVATFEFLSLFKAINVPCVLIANVLVLIASFYLWVKCGKIVYVPQLKTSAYRIYKALCKDKLLLAMGIFFIFFLIITAILSVVSGVNAYDSLVYHVSRSVFWVAQGSLAHYEIADIRSLIMPINSEIIYAWNILFFKEGVGLGLLSFSAFIVSVIALYSFLKELHFSTRKMLWSVFIFSSLASIVAQASSTETDLLLGALVFCSVYLFFIGAKEKNAPYLYMSSLAYALAIGTKTPAIMAFPSFLLICFVIVHLYGNKEYRFAFSNFFRFLLLNFVIFASYNYVLNAIQFGNPLSNSMAYEYHSCYGGVKGFIANLIHNTFLLFDFSGFSYSNVFGPIILKIQAAIFSYLHINPKLGVISSQDTLNNTLIDPYIGLGMLGLICFIPALFIAIFKSLINQKSKRNILLAAISLSFFINMIVLSFSLGYMVFSVRFIAFFAVVASPVLVFSYIKSNKNILKYLILFFVFSYFCVISINLKTRPFLVIMSQFNAGYTAKEVRKTMGCSETLAFEGDADVCSVLRYIDEDSKNKSILVFSNTVFKAYNVKLLALNGWTVDFALLEDLDKINLDNYKYIIANNALIEAMNVKYPERLYDYTLAKNAVYFTKKRASSCVYKDRFGGIFAGDANKKVVYSACYLPQKSIKRQGFYLKKVVPKLYDDDPTHKNTILLFEKPESFGRRDIRQ
ncbi:MAG: hypothetical protein PHV37_00225 [Candidatus Gastranaerophilales bacterium]|nr:hypothetical protein [Candidatus Gastranaerophilales bacterium]